MRNKNLKILFLYPNCHMSTLVPNGISILVAVLKRAGFNNIDLSSSATKIKLGRGGGKRSDLEIQKEQIQQQIKVLLLLLHQLYHLINIIGLEILL